MRGAVYDQQFVAETEIRKYDADSYRMGLQMTRSRRIDGMIGPDFGLYYQMKLEGMTRDQFGPPMILNTRMLYLLGSNSITPELATRLRMAVEDLRRSGAISAVAAKYVE